MSPKKFSIEADSQNDNWTESNRKNGEIDMDIATSDVQQEDDHAKEDLDFVAKFIIKSRSMFNALVVPYRSILRQLFIGALFATYCVYFGFAVKLTWDKSENYCDGVRFLFVLTVLATAGIIYNNVIKRFFGRQLNECCISPVARRLGTVWKYTALRRTFALCILTGILVFLVVDSKLDKRRLISVAGVFIIILLGYLFSKHPGHVDWRKTFWGLGLQFVFALFILRTDVGKGIFQCLGSKVATYLAYTDVGSSFIYGYLVTGKLNGWSNSTGNGTYPEDLPVQAQLFAFKVLPVIFFFSFCIAILYFYGIMQWIMRNMGWLLQVTIGTTAGESINAAAAIFVGQSEAPLVIKPYLQMMTMSELHAVMAGGFANIAGSTLAAYISFGINPSYLISASIMSAPAALGFSKLLYPETEKTKCNAETLQIEAGTEKNVLEAAANGATMAVPIVTNIAANLIAFIAFIYFFNGVLSWMGTLLEWDFLTLDWLLSKVFVPMAYIMGVEWDECGKVAKLIGMKTIFNEYIAYAELSKMLAQGELSFRAQTIATYALCGFANLSSIGIQLGCLGSICPERKTDFALVAFRALFAGVATNFITACVAGSLIDK